MLRLRFFDVYEKFSQTVLGPMYRHIGKTLALRGMDIQQPYTSDDRIVPSLRNVSIHHKNPLISEVCNSSTSIARRKKLNFIYSSIYRANSLRRTALLSEM